MLIIKSADLYSYRFGHIECTFKKLYTNDYGITYFDAFFKVRKEVIPSNHDIFYCVLKFFSQFCMDKSYFIPSFYFRVKEIILYSEKQGQYLLEPNEERLLQSLYGHFFSTADPHMWNQQLKDLNVLTTSTC
ncbi:MAG: hypothetical protein ACO23V_06645 [Chitinophagaceae bacterium]